MKRKRTRFKTKRAEHPRVFKQKLKNLHDAQRRTQTEREVVGMLIELFEVAEQVAKRRRIQ